MLTNDINWDLEDPKYVTSSVRHCQRLALWSSTLKGKAVGTDGLPSHGELLMLSGGHDQGAIPLGLDSGVPSPQQRGSEGLSKVPGSPPSTSCQSLHQALSH